MGSEQTKSVLLSLHVQSAAQINVYAPWNTCIDQTELHDCTLMGDRSVAQDN